MTTPSTARMPLVTSVLVAACVLLLVSNGIRSSFGVFQIPIAEGFGWPRAEFSLALAIQNLAWGIGQPIFGAIADRMGDRRAITLGALLYAAGMLISAGATDPLAHQALQFLVGFGFAGVGFGVILAMVGRAASDANRSMALALAAAMGSVGQVLGAPIAELLVSAIGWQTTFVIFAGAVVASLAVLPAMKAPVASADEVRESLGQVLGRAFRDPSYTLIFLGFFSCGYQVAFMTAHFPAFVTEASRAIDPSGMLASLGITSTAALGALSIALIGLANVAGTLAAGWLGSRFAKKYLLAAIYLGRAVVAAVFIMVPMTPTSVILFSVAMGLLWLATVPLTSGLVAYIYGLRNMGMLYGIVFFSHQLGSFLGVWLGGRLFDATGGYTAVWWVGVGVGLFSALVHLPVRERPLAPAVARTA